MSTKLMSVSCTISKMLHSTGWETFYGVATVLRDGKTSTGWHVKTVQPCGPIHLLNCFTGKPLFDEFAIVLRVY